MNLVSVIVPYYNKKIYIYKTVKSNCSYFMSEEEIKVSFQCINDILKKKYNNFTQKTFSVFL